MWRWVPNKATQKYDCVEEGHGHKQHD
ncbi:hypothetical protein [Peribacillus simplex]